MIIDWSSLGLVALVTVLGTAFIVSVSAMAAHMLDSVHIKRQAGTIEGLHAAEVVAGFFLILDIIIMLFGLWLIIPYFH